MTGPRYCEVCGLWPAMETLLGLRCHLCECRDYSNAHPVPLPNNPKMLRDLANIGVRGEKKRMVQCPICEEQFRANDGGALVLMGAGDWKGMDVIRCPKCLNREHEP